MRVLLRRAGQWFVLLCAGAPMGCDLIPEPPAEIDCSPRTPFWPDADQDGVGDSGASVYIGCEAPEGYTDVGPDGGTVDTADTGTPIDDTDTDGAGDSDLASDTDTDTDGSGDTDLSPDTDTDTDEGT